MCVCVFIFGRKIVVFVIVNQSYLCNGTFCKSLLSCGDAVVLLVAGKRWLSQPDQESKRSYWEEPCHILVSFLCPSLPYNTLISFYVHLLHSWCTTLEGTCHGFILRRDLVLIICFSKGSNNGPNCVFRYIYLQRAPIDFVNLSVYPGVHFSLSVLLSWADRGSCAHKCVC